ncbi:MAG: ImmA/IrrE family metallo-endopeptidase [Solobacterium sp.]|nr:ImmA/IrrE family metallo-endopeptidase [Solobacterium sp.]
MTQLTIEELSSRLEEGVRDVFSSDSYRQYLNAMSRFHHYSYSNTLLILAQKPDASYVAGFKTWNDSFNRRIRKGEKAIRILRPLLAKTDDTEEEQEKRNRLSGFTVCSVFDISQTEGDEIPLSLTRILDCHVEDFQTFISALILVSPVPVAFREHMHAYGCFYPLENRIEIRSNLPQAQTVKTMIHEIAHATLHRHETDSGRTARSRREIEAESVAYIVSTHYGIDTSSYSFGYIASWSKDKDLATLKTSLQAIQQAAAHLISLLDCVLFPAGQN